MKKNLLLLAACAAFALTGCETVSKLWNRPETQVGIEGLTKAAFSFAFAAGTEAARQVATGQTVDAPKVALVGGAAALYTAASYIRQLQATKAVLDANATAKQLEAGGIPALDAEALARAITANAKLLTAQGVPADRASEINASAFDAAAKAIQEGAK